MKRCGKEAGMVLPAFFIAFGYYLLAVRTWSRYDVGVFNRAGVTIMI
jgi:hypothetical protein